MSSITLACKRCHIKKIKCDSAKPSCRTCTNAKVQCRPHERLRRGTVERDSQSNRRRLVWLEEELSNHLAINVHSLETGTDLQGYLSSGQRGDEEVPISTASETGGNLTEISTLEVVPNEHTSEEIVTDITPDISLLTLNATGELRYLGPSSGSFFAKYASNCARVLLHNNPSLGSVSTTSGTGRSAEVVALPPSTDVSQFMTPSIAKYLLNRYSQWVHPLYPLLDGPYRQFFLEPLCNENGQETHTAVEAYAQRVVLIIYHLALALGAVHATPCEESSDEQAGYVEYQRAISNGQLSSDSLFIKALELLDSGTAPLQPSVSMIQILLLICIYGGYKPSGNRQWQLSGIAIRMCVEIGLHRHRDNWRFSPEELDLRRRVFWTAYSVELTVAFNLGRPSSIPDEHIDAMFPEERPDNAMALHHIRHRQIQSKILTQLYCAPIRFMDLSEDEKSKIIQTVQSDLDTWKDNLPEVHARSSAAYPIEYWDRMYYSTSTAVYRPTPLSPRPSLSSSGRCLRCAGQYIDIHHSLLRSSNIPQSWMLLQGMLLHGITILVTCWTVPQALEAAGCSIFDIMEWNRKCSIVLNIMSERWAEKSLSDLETKFSLLATETLKRLLAHISDTRNVVEPDVPQDTYNAPRPQFGDDGQPDQLLHLPNITHLNSQLASSQDFSGWAYQEPYQSPTLGNVYGDQNGSDYGAATLSDFLQPGNFSSNNTNNPISLEGLFGVEDLFSFWGVFPASSGL